MNMKFGIGVVIAIVLQVSAFVWWTAQQAQTIETLKSEVSELTSKMAVEDEVNMMRDISDMKKKLLEHDEWISENYSDIEDLIDDSEINNHIFCGYDGSIHTTKPLRLGWHKLKIQNKKIQILPSIIRKFPDDYNIFQRIFFLIFREIIEPGRILKKFFKKKS